MRTLVRMNVAVMGLSAAFVPGFLSAQTPAPAGYAPAPSAYMSAPQPPMAAKAAGKPVAAPAPHKHKGRMICANCAKKQEAMPAERIVACAHSKNGVCPTCQALLAMPGTVTIGAPAPAPAMSNAPAEAPGRAVVSSSPVPTANANAPAMAVYDPSSMPEPAPVGVMQANYARPGAMPGGMPGAMPAGASSIPTAGSLQPGHSIAAAGPAGASPAPFQHKNTSSKNPKVISHLLGFGDFGAEWREQRANKKSQAHASIPYNSEGTTINEIPASMVYDRSH